VQSKCACALSLHIADVSIEPHLLHIQIPRFSHHGCSLVIKAIAHTPNKGTITDGMTYRRETPPRLPQSWWMGYRNQVLQDDGMRQNRMIGKRKGVEGGKRRSHPQQGKVYSRRWYHARRLLEAKEWVCGSRVSCFFRGGCRIQRQAPRYSQCCLHTMHVRILHTTHWMCIQLL
jgi:hypothetical protein